MDLVQRVFYFEIHRFDLGGVITALAHKVAI